MTPAERDQLGLILRNLAMLALKNCTIADRLHANDTYELIENLFPSKSII